MNEKQLQLAYNVLNIVNQSAHEVELFDRVVSLLQEYLQCQVPLQYASRKMAPTPTSLPKGFRLILTARE